MTTSAERRQALFDLVKTRPDVVPGIHRAYPDCAYFTASEETEAVMV